MWHLPREIFYLTIESLNEIKSEETQRVIVKKKASKWEISIKGALKISCIWILNVHF